ncbi:beta-class carbonic anhydrase [Streptomyces megasporus]|uniref:beta-class carbonic anhydrase n=1 Tax=Streptomyces megasporus TaxID=44060 RepID=UPI0004E1E8CD|nr:carbonic anhydrase [Streptomyces megasporus]
MQTDRTATDAYLAHNLARATGPREPLPMPPARRTAVVTCMDARLDVYALLGLSVGDSHVFRNAGGIVTDDVIRSLAVSQRLLNTREIILVHHTDCGMATFADGDFLASLEEDAGVRPDWVPGSFTDPVENVRASLARVHASPFIPHKESVRGFVLDLRTERLEEVRVEAPVG